MDIRLLTKQDNHLLCQHYLSLSPQSRYMRFVGTQSDECLISKAHAFNHDVDCALGLFDTSGELLGVAEVLPYPGGKIAELAFTVSENKQGHGYGRSLALLAIQTASKMGCNEIMITCLPTNHAMRKLSDSLGIRLTRIEDAMEGVAKLSEISSLNKELRLSGNSISECGQPIASNPAFMGLAETVARELLKRPSSPKI